MMSNEQFEAYLARQQAELQDGAPTKPTAPARKRPRGIVMIIGMIGPALFAVALVGMFWGRSGGVRKDSDDPWDKILGAAAWMTGCEYDADADNLTDRLRFRRKRD